MVKFEGKIGTLYQIFTPCFLKNSPHDVQTKGGGVKGFLNNVKKLHFSYMEASLIWVSR